MDVQLELEIDVNLSGRPRGFYRRVKLSRIALRDLAASGQIPGMIKASW